MDHGNHNQGRWWGEPPVSRSCVKRESLIVDSEVVKKKDCKSNLRNLKLET